MIRIDDERGDSAHSSSILFFWKIQYLKEMHGGRRGPSVHLFSSEHGPVLIRAGGANRETDAGTLKNDVPASIICHRRANEGADFRRQW